LASAAVRSAIADRRARRTPGNAKCLRLGWKLAFDLL